MSPIVSRNAVLVHGCCDEEEFYGDEPSPSNSHWFPWLQKELAKRDIETQTPEMPRAFAPEYAAWKRVLDCYCIDENTALVGHSCGAGFMLRWLGEEARPLNKLVLVAPWIDPFKSRGSFLDFELDTRVESRVNELHVLYSDNDTVDGLRDSIDAILKTYRNAQCHRFPDKGHFSRAELGTDSFPELLEVIFGD